MPERRRPRWPARLVGLSVALASLASAAVAQASFSGAAAASHSLSSATLQPASGLSATTVCNGALSKATLTWTATSSTFADGHRVQRYQGSTLQSTVDVTPRTTTTLTETGLANNTSYTWHLVAVKASWTSTELTVTKTTPRRCP